MSQGFSNCRKNNEQPHSPPDEVVLEVDGNLFVYTGGSGINKYNNDSMAEPFKMGEVPIPIPFVPAQIPIAIRRGVTAASNDIFGAQAFRALDAEMFKQVENMRKGQANQP